MLEYLIYPKDVLQRYRLSALRLLFLRAIFAVTFLAFNFHVIFIFPKKFSGTITKFALVYLLFCGAIVPYESALCERKGPELKICFLGF